MGAFLHCPPRGRAAGVTGPFPEHALAKRAGGGRGRGAASCLCVTPPKRVTGPGRKKMAFTDRNAVELLGTIAVGLREGVIGTQLLCQVMGKGYDVILI